MSGSFYHLSVNPKHRRLAFSMGLPLRVSLGLFWLSLTAALAPALLPDSGIVIEPEGAWPAGILWGLATLGLGWRDSWVFEAQGRFHRIRGWFLLAHRRTRSLAGFAGWKVETHAVRTLDWGGRRGSLRFKTDSGQWTIDSRFRADWLDQQAAVLDLWTSWWTEGSTR